MNYSEKKNLLELKKSIVMKQYEKLWHDVDALVVEMKDFLLYETGGLNETIDYMHNYFEGETTEKIFRLAIALHYVANPSDKENVYLLKEDIKTNKVKSKKYSAK